jgi:uncharacterized protein involved in exopolysaccharide biosynthesis
VTASAHDPAGEQEVDFGRYWTAIASRWWLPLAGIVVGAVIGALVTVSSSTSYNATAQVYLGQPLAPGGAVSVVPVPTQLGLVSNLITSEAVTKEVAARVGLTPGKLRGHVTTKAITGITGAKLGTPAPLLSITVSGTPPAKVARAANALAGVVVRQVAPYQQSKIQALKDNLAYDDGQLKAIGDRLASAQANQQEVLKDKTIGATDKLVALANLNSVITLALTQQNTLSQDRFQVRQQLSLAQDVEAARLTVSASPVRAPRPSRKTAILIGAFIGLIVGIVAALAWEPIARRAKTTE